MELLRGYMKVDDLCLEIDLPPNAYLADNVYGLSGSATAAMRSKATAASQSRSRRTPF
jgi:hypothetical protein